jgi:hypothetical protein
MRRLCPRLVAATLSVAWQIIGLAGLATPALCSDRIGEIAYFAAGAKNVAVPFYSTNSVKCVAVLRAQRLFEDYHRSGFFRIGALPVLAIENLQLEIRDARELSTALRSATAVLDPKADAKRAVDGRQFTILFGGNTNVWIHGRRMRLDTPTRWRLDDVSINSPELARSFRRAVLHITGPRAGELVGETRAGAVTISLSEFAPSAPQTKRT